MAKNKPAVPVNESSNKSGRKFDLPDAWKAELLPSGTLRAVHVLTPALQQRLKDKTSTLPVVAVRSSHGDFTRMKLVRHVEILGPSFIGEIFDNPLEGTNGRAVAVLFSEYPLQVWVDPSNDLGIIDTSGKSPDQVMAEIEARLTKKAVPVPVSKPPAAPVPARPAPVRQPAPAARKPLPDGIGVGDRVEVVKGKKVPIGTTGKVFWVGDGKNGERIGFKDSKGETHWTALSNVELLGVAA